MSYTLLRPYLFTMEPEEAHEWTLDMLQKAHDAHLLGFAYPKQALPTSCMGINLINPVGLGAGLDKNGEYIDALAELGFGFLEIGTVTPKPQPGNEKPRLFRLPEAAAIINRMGFNNNGVDRLVQNVQNAKYQGVLGINIGKNAHTPLTQALDDYIYCLERVYPHASYITVNISSPNTSNLRSLQSGSAFFKLLEGLKECHTKLANQHGFYVPLAIKVAPDLEDGQIDEIAESLLAFEVDGLIATNTTISRVGVEEYQHGNETGGLSGRPLGHHSTQVVSKFAERLEDKISIIGVGGIDTGELAVQKIKAGATAVQVYSGLVYKGPALVQSCVQAIANYRDSQKELKDNFA